VHLLLPSFFHPNPKIKPSSFLRIYSCCCHYDVVAFVLAFLAVIPEGDLLFLTRLRSTSTRTGTPQTMRRFLTVLALLLITIPVGLAVRLLPLRLPWFLYKYLGSALWAAALYWFLAAIFLKLRPSVVATIAIITATLLELSRLIPIAPIDAFRLTFPGQILLGRYFSVKNIVAYVLAILITAILDHLLLSRYWQDPAAPACDTL
jgi:hypothetical protein